MTNKICKLGFTVMIVFCVTSASPAEDRPSVRQLIEAAHKISDLSVLGPYILTADVVINPGEKDKEKTGRLTIFRDHDRAREELLIENELTIRLTLGDKLYLNPKQKGFGGIAGFDQSWDTERPRRGMTGLTEPGKHVSKEKIHEIQAWCIELQASNIWSVSRHLCFDAARSVLLRESIGEDWRIEYSEFSSLGQQVFPQRVVMHSNEITEISHVQVQPATLKPGTFDVPDNMLELGYCENMKRPLPLRTPAPEFPKEEHTQSGLVALEVIVTKLGTVEPVRVVRTAGKLFDDAAVEGARTWKFKPATCGAVSVNTMMNIEISFNR